MATIAELKIIVDTAQVDSAVESINKLTESAGKVEGSADKMSRGLSGTYEASEKMASSSDRIIAKAKEMVETFGYSKGEVVAYKGALAGVGDIVKPLTSTFDALATAKKADDAITKEMTRSQSRSDSEKYKMLETLREEIALFGKSKDQITLYKAEKMGIVDSVRPLVEQLKILKKVKEESGEAGLNSSEKMIDLKKREIESLQAEGAELQKRGAFLAEEGAITAQLSEHQARLSKIQSEVVSKKGEIEDLKDLSNIQEKVTKSKKVSAVATEEEMKAFVKLRGQIDPTKAEYEKLVEQLEKVNKLRKESLSVGGGKFDLTELDEMEGAINENIKRLGVLSGTSGKTAKEINFAMRGLPAQFTDIATSIASGQQPLTVFLQQGGQIKDMFGGVGAALKNMATYVWGLITPFTVVAAVIGAVGIAALKGDQQVSKLNQAIIQGGNFASVTSRELASYADSVSGVYGTTGKAMEVMGQILTETKVHKSSIEEVTLATMAWSQATGIATSDILADFDKLSREPVAALQSLNDKYKFLTSTIYENVRALADSGDEIGATKLAVEALAIATEDKARLMVASFGTVSSAIHQVKGAAKGLFDFFAGWGRPDTDGLDYEIQAKHDSLAIKIRDLENSDQRDTAASRLRIRRLKKELEELGKDLDAVNRAAQREADAPYIEGQTKLAEAYEKTRADVEKAEEALDAYMGTMRSNLEAGKLSEEQLRQHTVAVNDFKRAIYDAKEAESGDVDVLAAKDRLQMARDQFSVEERVGAQQKELSRARLEFQKLERLEAEGILTHKEKARLSRKDEILDMLEQAAELEKSHIAAKRSSNTAAERASAADRLLQTLIGQNSVLAEQVASDKRLGREANLLNKLKSDFLVYEQRLRDGNITREEKSLLLNKESILTQQMLNVELEKTLEARERGNKLEAFKLNLEKALANDRQRNMDLVSSMGLSDRENEKLRERNILERERTQALQDAQQLSVETGDEEYYSDQILELEAFYDRKKELLEDYYETEEDLYENWQDGLAAGMENFLENNRNIYQTIKDSTESILTDLNTGIRDSLVQGLLYGESLRESFQSLAATITERVLGSLIDVGIQYLINSSMRAMAGESETATDIAGITAVTAAAGMATTAAVAQATLAGASITAAYTPAAIAASIATSGGAAVAASSSIGLQTPIMAASIASSSLAGFKDGGYTGNVGVNDVAGVVHGKEFVFDAQSTSRIGVDNLEKIRSGGQASGGGDINITTQISVNAEAGMSELESRKQGEAAADGFEAKVISILARHKRAGGMLSNV